MRQNVLKDKNFKFAVRVVRMYEYLRRKGADYQLIGQILRSGTSIGANIAEAEVAQSKKDFFSKCYIAYKEAAETEFWIRLFHETNYISVQEAESLLSDLTEIQKILSKTLYTTRQRLKTNNESH